MRFPTLQQWLAWQETLHPKAIDLSLDRVREVQRRLKLDRPEFAIITVAGTNGKGSSVALLEAIYSAAGYRVGAYTSPHLLRYNERIRVQGREVSDQEICLAFDRIDQARGEISLTYFEFGTLAALDIFFHQQLDVAILEVGLGGRLDAVNIMDADAALVTAIDIDHVNWLGGDRETIAREKAGIFRPQRPAVFSGEDAPASLLEYAAQQNTPLYCLTRDFGFRPQTAGWAWWGGDGRIRNALPFPALRGAYQLQNAAGVLTIVDLLEDQLPVGQQAVRDGLVSVRLNGRFQVVAGGIQQVFDVCHNPHAATVLADNLRSMPCSGKTYAIVGMMADKDISGTLQPLLPLVNTWSVAPLEIPRSASSADIAAVINTLNSPITVRQSGSILQAYKWALDQAQEGDRILIFGSFLTVAEILPKCL
jgi:dihydrofolate synthase/folylpolyglutamate synthase